MRSVAEHRAAAVALVDPVAARPVPLDEALGLITAVDIRSPIDLPRWDNAAMDGYAVRRCDVLSAGNDTPAVLSVIADLPAGSLDTPEVIAGTAARIMTGAPLPPGGDAVVAVEDTDAGTATVQLMRVPGVGANVRRAGEDVRVGDLVVDARMELGAAQIGAIASLGHATVQVHRPKVGVVSTGSELVDPGSPLPRGQIPDSNSYMLAAAARAAGADVVRAGAVPDDSAALCRVLADLEGSVDLVITSGGVSVGAYDLVKQLLGAGEVEFVRVAMQPGKPQGLGRLPAGTPVLCLPGNPVSAFVSFHVFVRPVIHRLASRGEDAPARAVVTQGWRSPAGREQYLPVVVNGPDDALTIRPAAPDRFGSHLVAGLARANGLAMVAAEVERITEGAHLDILRTNR